MLPVVEFAYTATRALGIGHTLIEANLGSPHKNPPHLTFNMRPSITGSQDVTER
jgi:hypothetical protein